MTPIYALAAIICWLIACAITAFIVLGVIRGVKHD